MVLLRKTEERNEKIHKQGLEGIPSEHTQRDDGISENMTL